jgi:RNA polymerase sigma factor (sigma-70 family)
MALPWQSRDARLVAAVRQGEPQAFEQLYARHQPAILSFCRHLTGHREDAEDAVQHTFLSAYCQIAESDDTLELRPWLFTVARNRCLSLLRTRSARGTVALDDADHATDGLALEVEQRQELRELVGDLSRLPEQQRAALLLAQLDDMSHREIGVVLGVAPGKVKALVFQARSSLASTREAREASCSDIRSQLATSHGSALRRRKLRRHVHECDGCRTFESVVLSQRRDLAILLPVAPSIGLREAILNSVPGRDAGALVGAGGAAATSVASGGAAGGGLTGTFAAIGAQGAAKLAVAGAVAVGGTGAIAADLPDRLQREASTSDVALARELPRQVVASAPDVSPPRAITQPGPTDLELTAPAVQDGPVAGEGKPLEPGEPDRVDRVP